MKKRILYHYPHNGLSIENEYRRCSSQWRKICIDLYKQRVSTISQKYYVYFPKDFTKILEQKILNRIIKKLGKLLQILQEK